MTVRFAGKIVHQSECILVTDSIIAGTSSFFSGTTTSDRDQTSFDPNRVSRPGSRPLNLRDALEWLLGAPPSEDDVLSQEERASRRNRRMELLVWLLNLEPRLAPYGE